MSTTAISFCRRNDTPSFVTWRSRLATAPPNTPTCIVIHGGQSTGRVHPPNQFVPEIVSPLPCSPALVRHTLLIVYFFKELISFIGSLDKCHTRVFNALILHYQEEIFSFESPLTLHHTILTFKDPEGRSLLKTLWEKEKMLVTSIFSFSHDVFNPVRNRNHRFSKI